MMADPWWRDWNVDRFESQTEFRRRKWKIMLRGLTGTLRFSPAHERFRAIHIIPDPVLRWTHLLNDDGLKHYQELGWSYHITVAESTMDNAAEDAALWTQLAQQWDGVKCTFRAKSISAGACVTLKLHALLKDQRIIALRARCSKYSNRPFHISM